MINEAPNLIIGFDPNMINQLSKIIGIDVVENDLPNLLKKLELYYNRIHEPFLIAALESLKQSKGSHIVEAKAGTIGNVKVG